MKWHKRTLWNLHPWCVFNTEDAGDDGGDDMGGGGGLMDEPVSPVKPDGTFVDNWRELLPEDIREEKCLETVTDFNNAIKQLVNHKKMVGKNKIALPGENAPEEEWNAFYSTIRGQDIKVAGDYKVEVPEELSGIYSEDVMKEAKEVAFKLGITQKQFADYMKYDMERTSKMAIDQKQSDEEARNKQQEETRIELKKEWGLDYDNRIHTAQRFVTEYSPNAEERERLMNKFGNDADFIRMVSRAGSKMSESDVLIDRLSNKTPTEAMARIKELQATPGYYSLDGKMTEAQRSQITAEIRELYKQAEAVKQAV